VSSNHKAPLTAFVVVAIACVVVLATNSMRSYAKDAWRSFAAPVVAGLQLMEIQQGETLQPSPPAVADAPAKATADSPVQAAHASVLHLVHPQVVPAKHIIRAHHAHPAVAVHFQPKQPVAPAKPATVLTPVAPVAPVVPIVHGGHTGWSKHDDTTAPISWHDDHAHHGWGGSHGDSSYSGPSSHGPSTYSSSSSATVSTRSYSFSYAGGGALDEHGSEGPGRSSFGHSHSYGHSDSHSYALSYGHSSYGSSSYGHTSNGSSSYG